MKLLFPTMIATLAFSSTAIALPGGVDNHPWKASADITNSSGHTGIVVTGSSYYECNQRFQDSMSNHAYYHGDTFGNIQNCSYNPFTNVVGGLHEVRLESQLIELEDEFNIGEYEQRKQQLLEQYEDSVEPLPQAPSDFNRK